MGELPLEQAERILITLPWPEPKEQMERLQKKFPHAEVIYKHITWAFAHQGEKPHIPEGTLLST